MCTICKHGDIPTVKDTWMHFVCIARPKQYLIMQLGSSHWMACGKGRCIDDMAVGVCRPTAGSRLAPALAAGLH